jgi:peroxiredoxin
MKGCSNSIVVAFAAWFCLSTFSPAQGQNVAGYESVPDPTLYLVREPAIHRELQLSDQQRSQLIELNESFDGLLLSTRNQPARQTQDEIAKVFEETRKHIEGSFSNSQQTRLRQILYRLRGISFVLLPSPSEYLELSDEQKERIKAASKQALETVASAQSETFQGKEAFEQQQKAVMAARKEEIDSIVNVLTAPQRKKLNELIGPVLDMSKLGRVTFRAPDLEGGTEWINSTPLSLEQLRGNVIAIHFMAFGCINCIHNYPWYRSWNETYSNDGLTIIGVHTPETDAEHDLSSLRRKLESENLKFPVVADNEKRIWNTWGNSMWPSVYLIDKQGRLRYWWYGELNWNDAGGQNIMAEKIEELLAE